MKKKVIVVAGPTASGKTALGIDIAKAVGGEIISEGEPHKFFSQNSFYTTATNKIMRSFDKNIITVDEAISSLIWREK